MWRMKNGEDDVEEGQSRRMNRSIMNGMTVRGDIRNLILCKKAVSADKVCMTS